METENQTPKVEILEQSFKGWTSYDDWLIENGQIYSIFDLKDENNIISIKYCKREDYKFLNK